MNQQIEAIVFSGPGEIGVSSFELCPCGDEDIVVRTLYSMVSPGTELRNLAGKEQPFPMIPGYASIGEVVRLGSKARGYSVGDLVSGRTCPRFIQGINSPCGGHMSHHVFPSAGEDRPVLLPPGAAPLDYIITEISSISLRGISAADPQQGETAIVLGQGLIGAFSASWLQAHGCRVIVSDLEESRLARALARGASAAVNGGIPDAVARLLAFANDGVNIVVESSASLAAAELACKLVHPTPRPYGGASYYKGEPISGGMRSWPRIIFQATYGGTIPIRPDRFFPGEGVMIIAPKDRGLEDRQNAVEAIRQGRIRAADFVENKVSYREAPAAYKALRDDKGANFSLVFDWTQAS